MRLTHLLALVATTSAAATAMAQDGMDGRVRISTAPRAFSYNTEPAHRAALGVGTSTSGTLRDTLGVLITSITRNSPAEKAGLEEGNRIAAINGVSLRANAADVEDGDMAGALTRRLTRELSKAKPGDDVELRVYRDGHMQTVKVKTADSDVLFNREDGVMRVTREDRENRPALGISIGSTGSRRDTLGVLVMGVADSTPAARAGLEEGNRIAAINGVSLKVAREDAGDRSLSAIKAQRLQREISKLKPGENVTLSVYSNGRFRDVTMKVARAGDLPKSAGGFTIMGGDGWAPFAAMAPMPVMPAMPPMPAMPATPMAPRINLVAPRMNYITPRLEMIAPRIRAAMERVRTVEM